MRFIVTKIDPWYDSYARQVGRGPAGFPQAGSRLPKPQVGVPESVHFGSKLKEVSELIHSWLMMVEVFEI